ncbi:catalase [Microbacterium halimionae]|uniref:Catalase n=1 Tax=Microbacterium halimionae TaxID=1526413 RepID=A0A7W3PKN9_9MICO|nr:catalase [Microbacterium halimionae]MBA8815024.1 catalase [Microbacterium halimionae]NII94185.1 catalase [Microbacterium halimionae]
MPQLPESNDRTSIATNPSAEAELGSTTDTGAPAPSDRNSLTVGADGPIVLHDVHFLNQMAHFNRERTPERNVHAKGSGAFGHFETTGDVTAYTKAGLFQPGVKTEMLARFSTVAGEQGSPDTWRDPRGFALKFYTDEGNYDLVGNNTPVFFIRDTMKFPHFIRSQKRRGGNGLRDNNMQWDFWSLNPESAHQVTYLMGDRGIPASYRQMNGYGSHTYMWVNAEGEKCWVKYHFHSNQGVAGLTDQDATRIAGEDADFHRRDLYSSIEQGDFPSWTLSVQIMPYEDAKDYRINPFDLTKIWPHADYPLIEVGTMTLDRNPDNFFAQIEQAAFEPSALVPGIGFSPDKMLLGRAFAYSDTHRHRIGANYQQLPVNRPHVELNTYTQDGPMAYDHRGDDPVYAPNSFGRGYADNVGEVDPGWESDGPMVRQAYTLRAEDDDFSQAGSLVRDVWNDEQRAAFVKTVAGHLLGGVTGDVLERAFAYWKAVDAATGASIEELVREKANLGAPGAQPDAAKAAASDPITEPDTNAAK